MKGKKMNEFSLFSLGRGFDCGRRIWPDIQAGMKGSGLGQEWDMGVLAQCVLEVENLDYLEIGTQFGGSLILAGMVKKEFGYSGELVSVDPYEESYPWSGIGGKGLSASPALLKENMGRFDLDYRQVRKRSEEVNWFEISTRYRIGVIYVDGDHSPAGFENDMEKAVGVGPRYIVVDNVDVTYPHIVEGVARWSLKGVYRLVHLSGITAVLERR